MSGEVKHSLLRTLPEEKVNEVADLIRKGTKLAQVAKLIQGEWKLLPDEKVWTVEKALARFRDDLANATVMKKLIATGAIDDTTKLVSRVDVLNEMHLLYAMQKVRINKLFDREDPMPMLLDQLGKEITRGNQLLAAIATHQFEAGITPRAQKVSNLKHMPDGSYQLTENSEDRKVIEAVREAVNAWTSDLQKINGEGGQDRELKMAALADSLIALDPVVGPVVVEEGMKFEPDDRWAFWKKNFLNFCDYYDTYMERPVGPREFVCEPQYLDAADALWPELLDIFCEINSGEYDVAVLTGGIGVGKTTLSIYTQAYQLYLLGCLRSPQRFYGQIETDEIIVIFQSLTATLAQTVDYNRFAHLVKSSPWFQKRFPPRPDLKSELHFPKRVIVKPGAGTSTAAIGQNVIGGLIDEVNFMKVVEHSKKGRGADGGKYDQAEELWNSIARRRESRFMLAGGRYPGVFCLLSSKQYPGEFTDRLVEQSRREIAEKGISRTYVYDKRAWEVRPDNFKNSKWFKVFIGDESRKPYIMAPGENITGKDAALVLEVPDEYRDSFNNNLLNALRDIGGVSTQALHPFMPNTNKVGEAFNAKFPTILTQDWCDFVEHQLALYPERVVKPDEPRFVHIDLAVSNDSAGIACGFVDRFVEVSNGPDVEVWPVIRFDYVLEVKPPRGDEISFNKIRELLYKQKDVLKMNMRWATLDSYQSRDTIQTLRQRGWITGLQSVDTDLRPYTFLKGAILDGRVECPPHERARRELAQLEWNALKKTIDHPPTGSKDVSDCMAGVVFGLTMRLEIWARHKVKTRLPARLMAEAQKKDKVVATV